MLKPKKLVEADFEYVTDIGDHKLFKKRKATYLDLHTNDFK
jgi:hypothetical protein